MNKNSKISGWLSKVAESFKKVKDDISEAVGVAATLNGEKDPVRKTHKQTAIISDHTIVVKGPFMLPISKTMKRKFPSRETQVGRIDWRSLERNKYAPWGVGANAVAHVN